MQQRYIPTYHDCTLVEEERPQVNAEVSIVPFDDLDVVTNTSPPCDVWKNCTVEYKMTVRGFDGGHKEHTGKLHTNFMPGMSTALCMTSNLEFEPQMTPEDVQRYTLAALVRDQPQEEKDVMSDSEELARQSMAIYEQYKGRMDELWRDMPELTSGNDSNDNTLSGDMSNCESCLEESPFLREDSSGVSPHVSRDSSGVSSNVSQAPQNSLYEPPSEGNTSSRTSSSKFSPSSEDSIDQHSNSSEDSSESSNSSSGSIDSSSIEEMNATSTPIQSDNSEDGSDDSSDDSSDSSDSSSCEIAPEGSILRTDVLKRRRLWRRSSIGQFLICSYCPTSRKSFKSLAKYAKHLDAHHEDIENEHKCSYKSCARSIVGFRTTAERAQHVNVAHRNHNRLFELKHRLWWLRRQKYAVDPVPVHVHVHDNRVRIRA